MRAMIAKDLSANGLALGGLVLLTTLAMLAFIAQINLGRSVLSYLGTVTLFAGAPAIVLSLIVGHLFVSSEYLSHTQRFLEALPIRRTSILGAKFVSGLGALWLLGGIALGLGAYAARAEFLEPRFIALMSARLGVWLLFVWSVVFLISLLGRWRLACAAVLGVGYYLITLMSDFEFSRAPPQTLIDSNLFAFERHAWPWRDLGITLILSAAITALAMGLGRLRDGSFAEALARPLTTRARTFLGALVVVLTGVLVMLPEREDPVPFTFTGEAVSETTKVAISYHHPAYAARAEQLLAELTPFFEPLAKLLDSPPGFRLHITLNTDIEPWQYFTPRTDKVFGVDAQANFAGSEADWSLTTFVAFGVHQWLSAASNFRVTVEQRHWLTDGFSLWWAYHADQPAPPLDGPLEARLVEALFAVGRRGIKGDPLRYWDSTGDALGDDLAMAYGYLGWRVLQDAAGHDALLRLARAEFTRPEYGDVRDWLADQRHPLQDRVAQATGLEWSDLLARFRAAAARLRARDDYAQALARLPIPRSDIAAVDDALIYRLEFDAAPPPDVHCLALHDQTGRLAMPMARGALQEIELVARGRTGTDRLFEHRLTGEYGPGEHVYAAIECQFPYLRGGAQLLRRRVLMP
ncbi:MAG: hypothetical protein AAF515_09520 [Pseudomonadota bacterium]